MPEQLPNKAEVRGTATVPTTTQTGGPALGFDVYKPSIENKKFKILIHGDSGVGKTTLAASVQAVPELCPALFVNIEGGDLSLSDPRVFGAEQAPDIANFESFTQLDVIYRRLAQRGTHPYKTVILDTYDELQAYNLDFIVGNKKSVAAGTQDVDEIYLEDYGTSTKQLRRVTRKFRDLDMNVILVTHSGPVNNKPGALIGPMLTPKLRASVEGMMDIVAYMYTQAKNPTGSTEEDKKVVRKILTRPMGVYVAKDRTPGQKLGGVMIEPSMAKIMAAIRQ